jgi:hypothetical protein
MARLHLREAGALLEFDAVVSVCEHPKTRSDF